AKDFRIAMMWLCRARLDGGEAGTTQTGQVTEWLTGHVRAVSVMKPYQIFTKINRTNARHLLESLFVWVREAGESGVVILLDITRLTERGKPADASLSYSKSALLDAYEVLRQFVDSTDDLAGALLVAVADEQFLDTAAGSRGLGAYQALQNRIYD